MPVDQRRIEQGSPDDPLAWLEANQQALDRALSRIRRALSIHAARRGQPPEISGTVSADERDPEPEALVALARTFQLSPFERDLLLFVAGPELDGSMAELYAAAHGDPRAAYPTLGLALAALPNAHWSATASTAPLRRWRMIDVASAHTMLAAPLRIDERILQYLTGTPHTDERLASYVLNVTPSGTLAPSHEELVDRVVAAWTGHLAHTSRPVIQLTGDDDDAKLEIVWRAAAAAGLRVNALDGALLPTSVTELNTIERLWTREGALTGSVLLLDCEELDTVEGARATPAIRLAERCSGLLVITSPESRRLARRASVGIDVLRPPPSEQRAMWTQALGPLAHRLGDRVDALISQFNLGAYQIVRAVDQALSTNPETPEALRGAIWNTVRTQSRRGLDELAQRIETKARFDDLVLPPGARAILGDVVSHVRQRAKVYEQWGFGDVGERGLGVSALFSGGSGTGKTLAAEVVANELSLDLYRIDLSAVVSKYIGETEKNLSRIFHAAESGGAILLFDEADALFGKRSEVKDAHDRHANIEVSYLLQRMESYRGLSILTTNFKSALDGAFMRRIRFVVHFPFPDHALREAIWRRVFPRRAPLGALDFRRLAQLNVTGGHIRSIALKAAFIAADGDTPVEMQHVLRAATSEYAKLERTLTESELTGWHGTPAGEVELSTDADVDAAPVASTVRPKQVFYGTIEPSAND
jgi:hypothetical protein